MGIGDLRTFTYGTLWNDLSSLALQLRQHLDLDQIIKRGEDVVLLGYRDISRQAVRSWKITASTASVYNIYIDIYDYIHIIIIYIILYNMCVSNTTVR